MKGNKYSKILAKIQVSTIFHVRYSDKWFTYIERALYGETMWVLIRVGTNMAAENQQKHLTLSFAMKA